MRARRGPSPALFTLCAVLALSGCSQPRTPEVATAESPAAAQPDQGPATTATATAKPGKETDYDKALRYTRCMNEHGEQMDDPVEGKPLPLMGKNHTGGGGFQKVPEAFDKCKRFMPATWPVKADPKDLARERPYGECMRKHGIDYPQPDADGMVHYPTDPTTLGRPDYQAADAACRHLVEDPTNDAG